MRLAEVFYCWVENLALRWQGILRSSRGFWFPGFDFEDFADDPDDQPDEEVQDNDNRQHHDDDPNQGVHKELARGDKSLDSIARHTNRLPFADGQRLDGFFRFDVD